MVTIEFWVFVDIDELRNCANSPVASLLLSVFVTHDAISQFFEFGEHFLLFVS
ncbi:hypothetical protein D3C87_2007420 [compost metagenome]